MQRRHFVLSAGTVLTASAALGTSPAARAVTGCADPAAAFAAARASQPWTLAFESLNADLEPMPLALHGRLPRGLAGRLYRNGPARHVIGSARYRHWFDGDGAVQRFDIGLAGQPALTHRARFVRTPKFEADSAAGRPRRAAFATAMPGMEPVRSADSINAANTRVVHPAGRLLALWEGGSAFELDAATLATRGMHHWSAGLAGMPFSAHPRIEPDGTMWNFGVAFGAGALVLYRIDAAGALQQSATLRVPHLPMVHDFAITERYLVFLLTPFVWEPERARAGATFLDIQAWRPELGLRALVIDKGDLAAAPRWFELPAGFVFHLGSACEDRGVIRLDCARAADASVVHAGFMDLMCGRHAAAAVDASAQPMLVELDLMRGRAGRARQTLLPLVAEFPRVDPRTIGRRYGTVFMLARSAPAAVPRPLLDSVARVDLERGRIERYDYGPAVIAEEHVFVPRAGGAEGQGWLVGSALDLARRRTLLSVFDAERLADGPLAQGEMSRTLPVGLHGTFVAA
jgi:carotenoid cleavage dioxygenase